MTTELPAPDAATDMIASTIPFVGRMGVRVEQLEPGFVRLSAPLAGNENHVGTMYAGALYTLAEVPGGILVLSMCDPTRFYPVLVGMSVRYHRPATSDVTVSAHLDPDDVARLERAAEEHGRAEYMLRLEVTDTAGTTVMTSEAQYQLRRHRA